MLRFHAIDADIFVMTYFFCFHTPISLVITIIAIISLTRQNITYQVARCSPFTPTMERCDYRHDYRHTMPLGYYCLIPNTKPRYVITRLYTVTVITSFGRHNTHSHGLPTLPVWQGGGRQRRRHSIVRQAGGVV